MALPHAPVRRFNRQEYHRMAETGVLRPDERVELINGEVVSVPSHSLAHSLAVQDGYPLLAKRFGGTHKIRCQLPVTLSPDSEPEPDFALATSEHIRECALRGEHPSCPDLVIEIADTSLSYDRNEKASLYARAGIPEYWILNLRRRCLEVRCEPGPDPEAALGYSYKRLRIVAETDSVAPLFSPATPIGVSELLPPMDLTVP